MQTDVTPERSDLVDRLLADPPAVHAMGVDSPHDLGVWSTDRDCYLLLAAAVQPTMHTLETGAGISTVLFAALGTTHVCITPSRAEADRIIRYCMERAIATDVVRFEIGFSENVLPRVECEALDLVFIDGGHGFPAPMIDWYYAGSRLRRGGIVVLDDVALPGVAHLCAFLDGDPRFEAIRRTPKWRAYRRNDDGALRQEWYEQPFYRAKPAVWDRARSVIRRAGCSSAPRRPGSTTHGP